MCVCDVDFKMKKKNLSAFFMLSSAYVLYVLLSSMYVSTDTPTTDLTFHTIVN